MVVTAASAGQRPGGETAEGTIVADAKINGSAASGEKLHGSKRQNERQPEHNLSPRRVCLLKEYRTRLKGSMRDYAGRWGNLLKLSVVPRNSPSPNGRVSFTIVSCAGGSAAANDQEWKGRGSFGFREDPAAAIFWSPVFPQLFGLCD